MEPIQQNPIVTPNPTPAPVPTTSVNPESHSSTKKIFIIVGFLLVLAAIGGYFFLYGSSIFKKPIVLLTPLEVVKNIDNNISINSEGYDEYFSRRIDANELGTDSGLTFVQSENMAVAVDGQYVHIAFSPVPNVSADNSVLIKLSSVLDQKGNEVLDVTSSLESDPFFIRATPEGNADPIPYMVVDRSAHLIEGVSSANFQASYVKGELIFNLPLDIKSTKIFATDLNIPFVTSNATTTIINVTPNEINFTYDGFQNRMVSAHVYDKAGSKIECPSMSRSSDDGYDVGEYYLYCDEESIIDSIFISDATGFYSKKIPFEIRINDGVVPVVTQDAKIEVSEKLDKKELSAEDKKLVIESKVRMFEVFSTKDVAKIRAYLDEGAKASGDPKQINDISNMSDKDLLFFTNLLVSVGFQGMKNSQDIRNVLNSDKTTWTKNIEKGHEHMKMVINIDDSEENITLEAFKFGDIWY